jgi:hypothetical protein
VRLWSCLGVLHLRQTRRCDARVDVLTSGLASTASPECGIQLAISGPRRSRRFTVAPERSVACPPANPDLSPAAGDSSVPTPVTETERERRRRLVREPEQLPGAMTPYRHDGAGTHAAVEGSMTAIGTFPGIDIAKADVVVPIRPDGTTWTATNDPVGIHTRLAVSSRTRRLDGPKSPQLSHNLLRQGDRPQTVYCRN